MMPRGAWRTIGVSAGGAPQLSRWTIGGGGVSVAGPYGAATNCSWLKRAGPTVELIKLRVISLSTGEAFATVLLNVARNWSTAIPPGNGTTDSRANAPSSLCERASPVARVCHGV